MKPTVEQIKDHREAYGGLWLVSDGNRLPTVYFIEVVQDNIVISRDSVLVAQYTLEEWGYNWDFRFIRIDSSAIPIDYASEIENIRHNFNNIVDEVKRKFSF